MLFKKTLSASLKSDLDSFIRNTYEPPFGAVAAQEAVEDKCCAAPVFTPPKARKASAERTPAAYETTYGSVREAVPMPTAVMPDLDRELHMLDESFQQMLLRKIDEKNMKDSACYKRAGVDRKLFSKIRSNPGYKPKKATAIAFCIALELPFDEAAEMLRKAGYALSRSSKFDVIVEYFIRNRRYDINELNIALYEYDQPVIG